MGNDTAVWVTAIATAIVAAAMILAYLPILAKAGILLFREVKRFIGKTSGVLRAHVRYGIASSALALGTAALWGLGSLSQLHVSFLELVVGMTIFTSTNVLVVWALLFRRSSQR